MNRFNLDDEDVVVIVGAGAGGGTLAMRLTQAGRKVVLLEAGKYRTNDSFVNNEAWAGSHLIWNDPRTTSGDHPDVLAFPGVPATMGRGVGGTLQIWTGLTPRLKAHELRTRSVYGDVDGAGLADWPMDLDDIAPYYERAEQEIGTSHRHGRPPMPANNNYKVFANGAKALGYRLYATGPYATNVEPFDGRPGTIQDGFNMQGDRTGAKWTTLVREIPRAIATGLLDLRTDCQALTITLDAAGRADGVVYVDPDGVRRRQRASVVAIAGNAIETPRLLLMSAERRHPHGLANSSDLVGRYYTRHVTGYVLGHFERPVHMNRGENMAGILADEAKHEPARGFVGGYYLETVGLGPVAYATLLESVHREGPAFTERVEWYSHTAALWICGEDMPMPDNRVTLDESARDDFGNPIPHIHLDQHPNDAAMRNHAWDRGTALYEAVGALETTRAYGLPSGHNHGTTRMSADPNTGVVDEFGRCHDVPNLYVSDCSVFATSAAANPTLTLLALVHRQADHLLGIVSG
ncbi:GMC family oxidoreductase [Aeromicrobium ginsengisoli]|uniref:GMC family oxidoreductase n=1 Tax=Aeromicrobium ginsengisoli TaxID=363867 RepID=A0A5M4FER0_9ACTN|nr:GMC family oxidoreductase [Aeromicrobium ginsengisoli]KAA1397762.1 GMC family oxidoreductase [Aeromicrobium ginsengisoli]